MPIRTPRYSPRTPRWLPQECWAQAGEDDFIHPLYTVLKALGLNNLFIHKKADWRGELKPVVPPQSHFSSRFLSGVQQLGIDDVSAPPRKRQQQSAGKPYMSPKSAMTNAPTYTPAIDSQESSMMPAPPPTGSSIKTPRPGISMGIQLTALISALSSQDLNKFMARTFLKGSRTKWCSTSQTGRLNQC